MGITPIPRGKIPRLPSTPWGTEKKSPSIESEDHLNQTSAFVGFKMVLTPPEDEHIPWNLMGMEDVEMSNKEIVPSSSDIR